MLTVLLLYGGRYAEAYCVANDLQQAQSSACSTARSSTIGASALALSGWFKFGVHSRAKPRRFASACHAFRFSSATKHETTSCLCPRCLRLVLLLLCPRCYTGKSYKTVGKIAAVCDAGTAYLQHIAALLDGRTRTVSHADVRRAFPPAQAQAFVLRSHACVPSWGEDDDAAYAHDVVGEMRNGQCAWGGQRSIATTKVDLQPKGPGPYVTLL